MCEHLCRGPSIVALMYGPGTKDCLLAVITLKLFWCCPAIQGRHFNYAWGRHQKGLGKVLSFFCYLFLRGGDMLRHATSEDCLKSYLNICHMHFIAISLQCIIRFNEWNEVWTLRIGSQQKRRTQAFIAKHRMYVKKNNGVNKGFVLLCSSESKGCHGWCLDINKYGEKTFL